MSSPEPPHDPPFATAASPVAPDPKGRDRLLSLLWLAPLLIPLVYFAVRYWRYTIDDAAITYAYAETWLDGGGLAFRPGEAPVEAYSNALWLFLLTPFSALGIDIEFASKALGLIGCGGAGLVSYALVRRIGAPRWAGALGVAFFVGAPAVVFWALSGLENGLVYLLVIATAYRALVDATGTVTTRARALGGVLQCLLVMTRPDGILYVAVCQCWVLGHAFFADAATRRARLRGWLVTATFAAASYGVYFALHYAYFGQLLPNSFVAKKPTESFGLFEGPGWRYLGAAYRAYGLTVPVLCGLVLALSARATRRTALLVAALLFVGLAFPVIAGGDWMAEWRLVTFSWCLAGLLIALGAWALALHAQRAWAAAAARWPRVAFRAVRPLALAGLLAPLLYGFGSSWLARDKALQPDTTIEWVSNRADFWALMGERAGIETPHVAEPDAGANTWRHHVDFLDIGLLGDLHLARYGAGFMRDYVFHEDPPQFFHLHGPWNGPRYTDMEEWALTYSDFTPVIRKQFDKVREINQMARSPFLLSSLPRPLSWEPATSPNARDAALIGDPCRAPSIVQGPRQYASGAGGAERLTWLVAAPAACKSLPRSLRLVACGTTGRNGKALASAPIAWAQELVPLGDFIRDDGWVTGTVEVTLSPALGRESCLALDARTSLALAPAKTPEQPIAAAFASYREALGRSPELLFRTNSSPLEPPLSTLACRTAGLTEVGQCAQYLRSDLARAELRTFVATVAVAQARAAAAPLDEEAAMAAAYWLVAGRRAAASPPVTEMDPAWRDAAELAAARLVAYAEGVLADAGAAKDRVVPLLNLAIRVDPSGLRARLLLEEIRREMPPPVRAIEAHLQRWLRMKLLRERPNAGPGTSSAASDAAALIASYDRTATFERALECLYDGPCAALRDDPAVAPWWEFARARMSGIPTAAPQTKRTTWSFEAGQPHGFTLQGALTRVTPDAGKPPRGIAGFDGDSWLDSFQPDDAAVGRALRSDIAIDTDFVGFLVAGGKITRGVAVELWVDGKRIEASGGSDSEVFQPVIWDLRPYAGRVATFVISDEGRGGWGHVMVDAISWLR